VNDGDRPGRRASRPDDERTPEARDQGGGDVAADAAGDADRTNGPDGAGGARPASHDGVRARELDEWQRALEAAGFTSAEASKLIFERVRPRREGRTRST
jgi:hypothetical protein